MGRLSGLSTPPPPVSYLDTPPLFYSCIITSSFCLWHTADFHTQVHSLYRMSHSYPLSFHGGRACPYKNVSACFIEPSIMLYFYPYDTLSLYNLILPEQHIHDTHVLVSSLHNRLIHCHVIAVVGDYMCTVCTCFWSTWNNDSDYLLTDVICCLEREGFSFRVLLKPTTVI